MLEFLAYFRICMGFSQIIFYPNQIFYNLDSICSFQDYCVNFDFYSWSWYWAFCTVLQLIQVQIHYILLLCFIHCRGCQIGMQGPQLCAKPRHFCKWDVATSRMTFSDLNLHILQVAISNSNNWGCSVVQNCTSDTP